MKRLGCRLAILTNTGTFVAYSIAEFYDSVAE